VEAVGALPYKDRMNDHYIGNTFTRFIRWCGKYDLDLIFGVRSCKFEKSHAPDPRGLVVQQRSAAYCYRL
jgi:hypothetical protein